MKFCRFILLLRGSLLSLFSPFISSFALLGLIITALVDLSYTIMQNSCWMTSQLDRANCSGLAVVRNLFAQRERLVQYVSVRWRAFKVRKFLIMDVAQFTYFFRAQKLLASASDAFPFRKHFMKKSLSLWASQPPSELASLGKWCQFICISNKPSLCFTTISHVK